MIRDRLERRLVAPILRDEGDDPTDALVVDGWAVRDGRTIRLDREDA
jgi:hypothetical protein